MSSFRVAANRARVFNFRLAPFSSKANREKRPTSSFVDNAPGWNEDLATASEAFVKADRAPTTLRVDEMQQKTVDYVQSQQHTNDPEVEPTHAPYAREEVDGPLGSAGMGEFEGVVGNEDLGPDDAQIEANGRIVTRRVTHEKTAVHEGGGGGQADV